MVESKGILVHCEVVGGELAPSTIEVLGAARGLANNLGQGLSAVLIGNNIGKLGLEAIRYGADKAYLVENPILQDYLADYYLAAMENVVKQALPEIILLSQSDIGRDLTPRLAFRLNTAATADCVAVTIDQTTKRLLMTKPVYGGNANSVQICSSNPQIATLRSKAMPPAVKDASRSGEVINLAVNLDSTLFKTKLSNRKIDVVSGIKLEEAHTVVAGGRGIGSLEGFKQLEELASLLKGAVGASRPPCDNKWIPDSQQIGLTGKIVSPELYIAIGISGASQHISGCLSSKTIVAINKDPEANIFKVAHYGIVADWSKALPSFTAKVKQLISS
jgi:electron transfer flavoprotein alpha subunit